MTYFRGSTIFHTGYFVKKIKVYMKIPNAPESNAGQVDSHNHTNNTKTQRCQHKPWDKTQTNFTVTITARDIRANFYGS